VALILAALTFQFDVVSAQPTAEVLSQDDAPVVVYSYDAEVKGLRKKGKEIVHRLQFANEADTTLVAVEFGVVSLSVFNDVLDVAYRVSMDTMEPAGNADNRSSSEFSVSPVGAFSFYTGIVFVSRTRLGDGSVWEADLDVVRTKIRNRISDQLQISPDSLRQFRGGTKSI